MKRSSLVAIQACLLGLQGCSTSSEDEYFNEPLPPVVRAIPAPPTGPSVPRSERVLILAWEREGDLERASLWDLDLRTSKTELRRRHTFGFSNLGPWPLHHRDGGPDLEYLEVYLRGEDRRGPSLQHLFRVDYETWDVRFLAKDVDLRGHGGGPRCVYFSGGGRLQAIDRRRETVADLEPRVRVVRELGDGLLVVRLTSPGATPDGALFDMKADRLLEERFAIPKEVEDTFIDVWLSPDRRRIAICDADDVRDPIGRNLVRIKSGMVMDLILQVQDLQSGERRSIPFRAQCYPGSSRGVLTAGPQVDWSADGRRLSYLTAVMPEPEPAYERVTIDASTTVEIARSMDEVRERWPRRPPAYLPAWLKADYDALDNIGGIEDEDRIALGFLRLHGIDLRAETQSAGTPTAYSPEGKRLLVFVREEGQFYFGDLETNELRRIPTPPSLGRGGLQLHWMPLR